ncbi:uncharacterized protein LOC143041702 [Oratosquilla oratoria]|uniref:uncharacterized protein LOC143041702 n=1 Tax=Oratosquilla oratoria TaxID=337810 RepID=UPI003F764AF4
MVRVILLLTLSTLVSTDAARVHHYGSNLHNYIIRPAARSRTFGWWGMGQAGYAPTRIPRPPVPTRWLPRQAPEFRASWVPSIPTAPTPNVVKEVVKGYPIPRSRYVHEREETNLIQDDVPVTSFSYLGEPVDTPNDSLPDSAIRALPPHGQEQQFFEPLSDSASLIINNPQPVESQNIITLEDSVDTSSTFILSPDINEVEFTVGKDLVTAANVLPTVNQVVPSADALHADNFIVTLDDTTPVITDAIPSSDSLSIVDQVAPFADVVLPSSEEVLFIADEEPIVDEVLHFGSVFPADVVTSDNILSTVDDTVSAADTLNIVEVDEPVEEDVIFLIEPEETNDIPQEVVESRSFYTAHDDDYNLIDTPTSYSFASPATYLAPSERRQARTLSAPVEFAEKPIPVPVPIQLEPLSMTFPEGRALLPWGNPTGRSARARSFNVLPPYRSHPRPWGAGRERRGRRLFFG